MRRFSLDVGPRDTRGRSRNRTPAGLAAALAVAAAAAPSPEASAQAPSAEAVADAARALSFRTIGPAIMGGRVSDLAVVENDPRIFYVGTATGGVWKTENAGATFSHVFKDEATASVGDVTVAPSNPNVVWVGTGEPQNRQSSPWGAGVYRSTDAGRTWTHLGLSETHHIARIQVHPRDPDVAYVAAVGRLWGPNPERGVYRTVDGGRSWDKVLFVDDDTGAIDLAMDPADPLTLFAAMYQRRRRAWGFNGGGPGSGVYRTTDGGREWVELTRGLPEGDKGRIGLDVFRGDGDLVFALVEADPRGEEPGSDDARENGVYRSRDRGESWEHLSTTNNRPMYYSQIRVDPNDPERIYLGGANLYRSTDGGRTFTDDAAAGVHLDHHALWIDPADSDHLILGGDGGVSVSWDRSENWVQLRNLPLGQFYEIGVDMRDPYHVCGGLQDNGSWCAPSDTWSNQGVRARDWYNVGSGDGFFTVLHPTVPDLMFAESQGGNLVRVDLRTGERARIRPLARPTAEEEDRELRWNWDTPMLLSAHDDRVLYAGANVLFRSPDLGRSWEEISPDLTHRIDRDTLELMGVAGDRPQMSRNDGQASYGNLTAIAESPLDVGVLYAGSDDGRLHVTRDGGGTWTDVTANVPGLPPYAYVTRLVASRRAAGEAFAVFDAHRNDDFGAYVYVGSDFGERWRAIGDGLPATSMNALTQHPASHDLLFAGSEVGVHFSVDGGERWWPLDGGLPTVPVDDLVVHPRDNDLVVGTHGLGIWIMDDVAPLEGLADAIRAPKVHLHPVRRATSYNEHRPQGWSPGVYEAPNPPAGARIRYHLAESQDSVTATVRAHGETVRELRGSGRAGLNEIVWDLRATLEGADGEAMDPGPRVPPGVYVVSLAAADTAVETDVVVRLDPRVSISEADLAARRDAMTDSYGLSGAVRTAEERLEETADRLRALEETVEDAEEPSEERAGEIRAFLEAVEEVGEDLDDVGAGAGVWRAIERASASPTEDQLWLIERAWEEVPGIVATVNEMLTERLPALYDQVYADGAAPAAPEPVRLLARER